jgi:hypothetical protein
MASVLDAVAAVMVKLMYETIVTGKALKRYTGRDGVRERDVLGENNGVRDILARGVGWISVFEYVRGQIGREAVNSALATLKASTQYAALMQGVIARVLKAYDAATGA